MASINKGNPQYAFIGALISGGLGYLGARKQAKAQKQAANQNYAAQMARLNYERSIRDPAINRAKGLLESPEWQKFHDRQRFAHQNRANLAGDVASGYLQDAGRYRQAGQQGLGGLQSLMGITPWQQNRLAQQYSNPYATAQYDLLARDANKAANLANRQAAARSGFGGDALSGQAARRAGQIEQQRQSALTDAATRIGADAYRYGADRADKELARRQGLSQALLGAGQTGLSQASSAAQLGSAAYKDLTNAPFERILAYNRAVSGAPGLSAVPQYAAPNQTNPWATAAGIGLQAYNLFDRGRTPSSGAGYIR